MSSDQQLPGLPDSGHDPRPGPQDDPGQEAGLKGPGQDPRPRVRVSIDLVYDAAQYPDPAFFLERAEPVWRSQLSQQLPKEAQVSYMGYLPSSRQYTVDVSTGMGSAGPVVDAVRASLGAHVGGISSRVFRLE